MSDKNLNTLVIAYKNCLANGEIQTTYEQLVAIVQRLRTEFLKKHAHQYKVANVLHGYIDYTYFYLHNDYLKSQKLKFAVVLNHKQANFELWLLGQTKQIQSQFWNKLKYTNWVNPDEMPKWSIIEAPLLPNPNFDDLQQLSASIHQSFETLSHEIVTILKESKTSS